MHPKDTTDALAEKRAKNAAKARRFRATRTPEHKAKLAEKARAYQQANREAIRAKKKEWEAANPEKVKEYQRTYAKNHPEKAEKAITYRQQNRAKFVEYSRNWQVRNPGKHRCAALRYRYEITLEQFEAMFEAQGRVCAICHGDDPKTTGSWSVDHCHVSGKVRGVLCRDCNTLLGMAGDRVEVLQRAAGYLKRHAVTYVF